jgi:peptide/nickel transport system permease protein
VNVLAALWRRRASRLGLILVALELVVALGADLLASELPLVARIAGRLHVAPCVLLPDALVGQDRESLAAHLGPGDWMLETPIGHGPGAPRARTAALLSAPSRAHWLGTDAAGRDVLARLVHGTRAALCVGLLGVSIAVLLGLVIGLLGGLAGGAVDAALGVLTEAAIAFPPLLGVLVLQALLERPSLATVILLVGALGWTDVARLSRAEARRLREAPFVRAARALGAGRLRILLVHVLPHALPPVLVAASLGIGRVLLLERALEFLGFGAPPPTPTWGELLRQAHEHDLRWWLALPSGLAIFLSVTAYNLVGEGFRSSLRLDRR